MRTTLTVFFAAALSASAAAQQGVPRIDITPSCRAAAAGAAGIAQDFDVCRHSEEAARQTLVQQWGTFGAADRASCHALTTIGTSGTYTEMLTCLEMKRDARKLEAREPSTVGMGTRRRR